jgi:hypothetical protein
VGGLFKECWSSCFPLIVWGLLRRSNFIAKAATIFPVKNIGSPLGGTMTLRFAIVAV